MNRKKERQRAVSVCETLNRREERGERREKRFRADLLVWEEKVNYTSGERERPPVIHTEELNVIQLAVSILTAAPYAWQIEFHQASQRPHRVRLLTTTAGAELWTHT